MQSPEGQSREKDERGPDSVIPFCLVDIYLHNIRICLQKYKNILYFCRQIRIIDKEMKKTAFSLVIAAVVCACSVKNSQSQSSADTASNDSVVTIDVKYATGFSVRDSADVRLVDVGKNDHFALVQSDDVNVPNGYTKIRVPIENTICMTALQLSNFTILDAHDVVKGITGTKNLFNKDILERVKDGRIVKIGMEGNFDTELVLAANPDVIFISPSKRGGYDAIKETGITLVPHLGYQELDPLGQAEWIKFVGMFIGKEREANEIFAGIENRYNELKSKADSLIHHPSPDTHHLTPTVFSGEMHYGNWHAVGGKNYLAQIFRDAGADYVINDEETSGEDLEFEKMYALAAKADYWRILNSFPGEFTYEALKASEPRNELFKAYKERKVIYCNMKQQAYYEISPVQPDVLLKDFVAIFHPELVEPDYQPTYYRLLK
jgi:iron complex transport system substrate-binding protein